MLEPRDSMTRDVVSMDPALQGGSNRLAGLAAAPAIKPIVVATDASPTADAAFTMAKLLAHRCGLPVEVVTVVEPSAGPFATPDLPRTRVPDEVARMEELRARVRRQLDVLVGERTGWPVDTRYGEAAPTVHRKARDRDAELLIMGVNRHGLLHHLTGDDTTAHVTQLTGVPLLAVAANVDRLPRDVVVALSAGVPAIPQSTALRTLLSEVETVHFVHVRPPSIVFPTTPVSASADDLESARRRIMTSLGRPLAVAREPVVVSGDPAKELAIFANSVGADLIIVGQRRRRVLGRWTGGGLAARLLREPSCSLLLIPRARQAQCPPLTSAAAMAGGGHTETLRDRSAWDARLSEISRRNTGRPVMVELDDPTLGARVQAIRCPFLGIDYDRGDDRITITLGDPDGGSAHLTHSVSAPVSLGILEGVSGKTLALLMDDEHGQTVLTFLT